MRSFSFLYDESGVCLSLSFFFPARIVVIVIIVIVVVNVPDFSLYMSPISLSHLGLSLISGSLSLSLIIFFPTTAPDPPRRLKIPPTSSLSFF